MNKHQITCVDMKEISVRYLHLHVMDSKLQQNNLLSGKGHFRSWKHE